MKNEKETKEIKIEDKEYTIQNLKFKMKKRSISLRKFQFNLLKKIQSHTNELCYDNKNVEELSLSTMIFLYDEKNLKMLFDNVLDGDTDKLKYEIEKIEEIDEMAKVGNEICNDFFSYFNKA